MESEVTGKKEIVKHLHILKTEKRRQCYEKDQQDVNVVIYIQTES